jgi:hypothetical protein
MAVYANYEFVANTTKREEAPWGGGRIHWLANMKKGGCPIALLIPCVRAVFISSRFIINGVVNKL